MCKECIQEDAIQPRCVEATLDIQDTAQQLDAERALSRIEAKGVGLLNEMGRWLEVQLGKCKVTRPKFRAALLRLCEEKDAVDGDDLSIVEQQSLIAREIVLLHKVAACALRSKSDPAIDIDRSLSSMADEVCACDDRLVRRLKLPSLGQVDILDSEKQMLLEKVIPAFMDSAETLRPGIEAESGEAEVADNAPMPDCGPDIPDLQGTRLGASVRAKFADCCTFLVGRCARVADMVRPRSNGPPSFPGRESLLGAKDWHSQEATKSRFQQKCSSGRKRKNRVNKVKVALRELPEK